MNCVDPKGMAGVALRDFVGEGGGAGVFIPFMVMPSLEGFKPEVKQNTNDLESRKKEETEPKGGHTKNKRKSTKEKHQKADKRRKSDQGGEKGDARRPYQRGYEYEDEEN